MSQKKEEESSHLVAADVETKPGHKLLSMMDNRGSFSAYRRASIAAREGGPSSHEEAMAAASAAHEAGAKPKAIEITQVEAEDQEKRPEWEFWARGVKSVLDAQDTKALVSKGHVVSMRESDTLSAALGCMRTNALSGIAVKEADSEEVVGVLELSDILAVLVKQPRGSYLDELEKNESVADKVLCMTINKALCAAGNYNKDDMMSRALTVDKNCSVSLVLERLAEPFWRVVLDGFTTISQRTLVQHLAQLNHPTFQKQPLIETHAINERVLTVDAEERASMALAALVHFRVHVLAVRQGRKLIGEISVYSLAEALFHRMDEPVGNLMPKKFKLRSIHHGVTVQKALEVLADQKKHHVWVVDRTKQIIGLLTITGLLKSLLKKEPIKLTEDK